MKTVKELLEEVAAETNAVKAVMLGLEATGAFIDDLIIKAETGDLEGVKTGLKDLQSLNTGLVSAVPASVTPESAGTVGKSRAQQLAEQAEVDLRAHMGKLAEIMQSVSNAGEHIRAAAQAIADSKALG